MADRDPTSGPEPTRPSRRWRMARGIAAVLAAAFVLAGGVLTHFAVHPGQLAATDGSLMLMQRMGPPPDLLDAYEDLNADTAVIRDRSTGRVVATGVFLEALNDPAALPAFTSLLPGSVRHLLEIAQTGTSYAVIYVAPLGTIASRNLLVDSGPLRLPGTVIRTDAAAGLAAIEVTMTQGQEADLTALLMAAPPVGSVTLRQLILRRNPGLYTRSAGFVLTDGRMQANGPMWCDTPMSGGGSGAPIGYVSRSGQILLIGLAVTSLTPGRCTILGAWTFDQMITFSTASPPSRMIAYLGVDVESTAAAYRDAGYQGRRYGAYISSVEPASGAIEAGLRPGDVIIGVGRTAVGSPAALHAAIAELTPGRTYPVTFVRDGAQRMVQVLFGGILTPAGNG
jgi:hypothetical protein